MARTAEELKKLAVSQYQLSEYHKNIKENVVEDGKYINGNLPNVANAKGALDFTVGRTADRHYNKALPNGMGYVILTKDATFSDQVTGITNTIFEIRYDFDLGNKTVSIGDNCVLKFNGGKLSNGTLDGSNTSITAHRVFIFDNIYVTGTWSEMFQADWFLPRWNSYNYSKNKEELIDCHDDLEHLFNCGAKDVFFGSSKIYYTTRTVAITHMVNIGGSLLFNHDKANFGSQIMADSNITLLHYLIPSHTTAERIYLGGIRLVSGEDVYSDATITLKESGKTTPIVKVETTPDGSGLWGLHIEAIIRGNYVQSDRVVYNPSDASSKLQIRGMVGIEIKSVTKGSTERWISYIRIGGSINTYKGLYVHGDAWITDTEIYGEMQCVFGGTFEGERGTPIIIRGTQQTVRYLTRDNDDAFWEGDAFYNFGYVWDNANGKYANYATDSYSVLRKFRCNTLEGDISRWDDVKNVYNPQNVDAASNLMLGGLSYLRREEANRNIPADKRFACLISNNEDFVDDPDNGLYVIDGLKYIANTECIFNVNTINYVTNSNTGRYEYIHNNLPYPTEAYKEHFNAWSVVYTKYTGRMYSMQNNTLSNVTFLHNGVDEANIIIRDTSTNDVVAERRNVNTRCNLKDYIPSTFDFEIVFKNDKSNAYQKLDRYVRIPTFNFSIVNTIKYNVRANKIQAAFAPRSTFNPSASYSSPFLIGNFSSAFRTQSPHFGVLTVSVVWMGIIVGEGTYVTIPVLVHPTDNSQCKIISPYTYSNLQINLNKKVANNSNDTPIFYITIGTPTDSSPNILSPVVATILRIDGQIVEGLDETNYGNSSKVASCLTYGKYLEDRKMFHEGNTNSRNVLVDGYTSSGGTFVEGMKDKLYSGYEFYDTTLQKPLWWKKNADTSEGAVAGWWVDVNGEQTMMSHRGNNTAMQSLVTNNKSEMYDGYEFYNTTLKKPLWWNKAEEKWYDAAGTAI